MMGSFNIFDGDNGFKVCTYAKTYKNVHLKDVQFTMSPEEGSGSQGLRENCSLSEIG